MTRRSGWTRWLPFAVAGLVAGLVTAERLANAATTTTTMTVSLDVESTCSVSATSLAFGTVTAGDVATAQATITVNCAVGTSFQVALDAGQHAGALGGNGRTVADLGTGTHFAGYGLYQDAGLSQEWGDNGAGDTYPAGNPVSGSGTGSDQALTVFGQAATSAAQFSDTYDDVVTVTVVY